MNDEMTKDEFWDIQYKWTEITEESVVDQRRWVTVWTQVLQNPENEEYWDFTWEQASSESSEGSESDEVSAIQVYPKKVTTTIYVTEKQ